MTRDARIRKWSPRERTGQSLSQGLEMFVVFTCDGVMKSSRSVSRKTEEKEDEDAIPVPHVFSIQSLNTRDCVVVSETRVQQLHSNSFLHFTT